MWRRHTILDGWGDILFSKYCIYFYLYLFRTAAARKDRRARQDSCIRAAIAPPTTSRSLSTPLAPPPSQSQGVERRLTSLEANVAELRAQLLSRRDGEEVVHNRFCPLYHSSGQHVRLGGGYRGGRGGFGWGLQAASHFKVKAIKFGLSFLRMFFQDVLHVWGHHVTNLEHDFF